MRRLTDRPEMPAAGVKMCGCGHSNLFHDGHVAACLMQTCSCERFSAVIGNDVVEIPRETFERVQRVLEFVSVGRGFSGVEAYPDASARRALGELHDLGLLQETPRGPVRSPHEDRTTLAQRFGVPAQPSVGPFTDPRT